MYSFKGGCNRGVPRYTEVSSFQGVGIEDFYCTEVSPFQGVGIEESHRCPHFKGVGIGVSLYTEVSSFQGVGIEEFHCIQRCSHFRVLE